MIRVDRSGPDLSATVADLADALRDANRQLGRDLGRTIRAETLDAARAARGTLTLSGMRGRLGVGTRVFAGATRVTVVVEPKPAGPWAIVEAGADHPRVYPRAKRAVTPPKGPAASAPGGHQPGRHYWTRATDTAEPAILDAIEAVFDDALDEAR